jgi:hypothetical protein
MVERYCELTWAEIGEIDVIGSWLGGEAQVKLQMPNAKFIRFLDFYHFLHAHPWTEGLRGRKVLVVHPFASSIKRQYKIKDLLFPAEHVLPDFELLTYPAIQSIAGNTPAGFENWFEAFDYMKSDISRINFDIAIIGCGAYGMPLSVFVKRDLGKKAVHLGGNTQILFGIKGSRWENDPKFSHIINSHWIKPDTTETPPGHESIDQNCYW